MATGFDYRPDPATGERRVHVVQGEYHVTDDPSIVLTTILGSCVAACMRDPVAGVGGMNHFLLPDGGTSSSGPEALRYGVHSMELLVNGLLKRGARRDRLETRLFGGARMVQGLTDIGEKNGSFAVEFLRREGLAYLGGSLGGTHGRRVQFWPVAGRMRQMMVGREEERIFEKERRSAVVPQAPQVATGELELF
ncbi:chemotaxis protein CheD [Lutibaculum baratangense]|uniref:Probable chemoreceptor glutamine deamidase CheD n=1 Tax=Lutibaculum baratangense AMV1 TaxID=631454 RepID=V4TD50_9HYPH|nr:chemotaxis protein CheD [Lutibaculum baratangense]ESR24223.1 Chemotaxis protein CheD [Lutibaculum baratangense AMV1]